MEKRKFVGLINQSGLDDIGMSGLTFSTPEIVKGKIYEEYHYSKFHKEKKAGPSGYVIDDNGIWRKIGTNLFYTQFEEITSKQTAIEETTEFIYTQQKQLRAKEYYYIHHNSLMTDFQFDMLEKQSYELAKKLGFRADKHLGPEENEAHHIHWMIGFVEGSRYSSYNLLDLSL